MLATKSARNVNSSVKKGSYLFAQRISSSARTRNRPLSRHAQKAERTNDASRSAWRLRRRIRAACFGVRTLMFGLE